MAYTLYIGNKNYSSWSLRPWLVLRQGGIPFQEELVSLQDDPEKVARLGRLPGGRVPVLADGSVLVWDSLAICEYLAERHPGLWPADPVERAWARCISAEMHSGFGDLRAQMSMDVRSHRPHRRRSEGVLRDVVRIERIWADTRGRFGGRGDLLFGTFTIADAFYAPVAFRFRTYGVKPHGAAGEYLATLLALPAMQEWERAALGEERLADHDLDLLYPDD
jgi:glutathione S-transferase